MAALPAPLRRPVHDALTPAYGYDVEEPRGTVVRVLDGSGAAAPRGAPGRSVCVRSSNLARFQVPRDVRFVDRLPRNAAGKVLKTQLQADAHHD